MNIPKLAQIAKGEAEFLRYEDQKLWYRITWTDVDETRQHTYVTAAFDFPIPVADSGAGRFLPKMKGIELLRWARKWREALVKTYKP